MIRLFRVQVGQSSSPLPSDEIHSTPPRLRGMLGASFTVSVSRTLSPQACR